jgi:NADH-quinone oxidoreductase subunit J
MTYHLFLYLIITIAAVMAVMHKKMLSSAIMLAVMSIGVSLLLFNFNAPWAGVFELSVCAGLITVLFISAVSLLKKEDELLKENYAKFIILPFISIALFILGTIYFMPYFEYINGYTKTNVSENLSLGEIIWKNRGFDLFGQITILATAVFVIKSIFYKRSDL